MPFLLNYASSLGINKEITQTQAYSVWLQGIIYMSNYQTESKQLVLAEVSFKRCDHLKIDMLDNKDCTMAVQEQLY